MRFAAIDIGSNAVRLLFTEVFVATGGEEIFKKISLVRLPIRLGEDVFLGRPVPDVKVDKLIKGLQSFQLLADVYDVVNYRACGTSALRDASNGKEVIARIKEESGVSIDIIKGKEEAEIIYASHFAEDLNPKGCYLYVDVGGGSTELSIFKKSKRVKSESFNIGTLRLKNDLVKEKQWKLLKDWLEEYCGKYEPLMIIGTGGNINRLYKMAGLKDYAPLNYKRLKATYNYLSGFTLQGRIEELGLKEDRADVILPASDIFLKVMKWSGIRDIMVPKLGLADGIVHQLYEQHKNDHR